MTVFLIQVFKRIQGQMDIQINSDTFIHKVPARNRSSNKKGKYNSGHIIRLIKSISKKAAPDLMSSVTIHQKLNRFYLEVQPYFTNFHNVVIILVWLYCISLVPTSQHIIPP
jgi:hypothetical protein